MISFHFRQFALWNAGRHHLSATGQQLLSLCQRVYGPELPEGSRRAGAGQLDPQQVRCELASLSLSAHGGTQRLRLGALVGGGRGSL